jgi:nitroreductase
MDLRDGIRTNGTVRAFRPDPVDDAIVAQVLDDARFAPSGGNQQPWRVVLVKDPAIRQQLGELIRPVWVEYASTQAAGQRAFVMGQSVEFTPVEVPHRIVDDIVTAPVVLVVAVDLTRVAMMDGNATHRPAIVGGASIYPFCWNVLLAARTYGLAGVLTTFLSRVELQAAPVLGLPEGWALATTLVLGYPEHQPTRLTRRPVQSFTTVDRFDGEPLAGPT